MPHVNRQRIVMLAEYVPPTPPLQRPRGNDHGAAAAGRTVRVVLGTKGQVRRITPAQAREMARLLVAAADQADAAAQPTE